jgi:uncharacterized peroxidase-related enzyme
MEPMYLRDVEDPSKAQGVYADILRAMAAAGTPVSQIWHLFGFKPEATDHLTRFTEAVMRGPSPLSAGMRELIAAYTSASNQCPFCRNSHAAVARELLEDEPLVDAVIENLEAAPLPEADKALLRFVRKITLASSQIGQPDIDELHRQGWSDEAIYDTITVSALFNFYNRWVSSSGVHPLPDQMHRERGRLMAQHGYIRRPEQYSKTSSS